MLHALKCNAMLSDAKSSNPYKWSMLWCSKLKASKANYTTAMQYMKHMANTTQNSPIACQNEAKTCMEKSQNKLAWRAKTTSMQGQQGGLHYTYQNEAWDDLTNKNQSCIIAK